MNHRYSLFSNYTCILIFSTTHPSSFFSDYTRPPISSTTDLLLFLLYTCPLISSTTHLFSFLSNYSCPLISSTTHQSLVFPDYICPLIYSTTHLFSLFSKYNYPHISSTNHLSFFLSDYIQQLTCLPFSPNIPVLLFLQPPTYPPSSPITPVLPLLRLYLSSYIFNNPLFLRLIRLHLTTHLSLPSEYTYPHISSTTHLSFVLFAYIQQPTCPPLLRLHLSSCIFNKPPIPPLFR